jgi:hypothetical protein
MPHIVGIDTKTLFSGNTTLIVFKFLTAVSPHNQKQFIFGCARISTRYESDFENEAPEWLPSYKLALFSCVLKI